MEIKIALAGNPNCGKTTVFNALTGSNQYVGNWPGVTVEKKSGKLKSDKSVEIIDLPGIYSLSPYTLEEVVTRNFLLMEKPDAIINIVDSTNLERNLYLTTQLAELGIPIILALNMTDVLRKNGDTIDIPSLTKALGCQVVETAALKGEGLAEVTNLAIQLVKSKGATPPLHKFSKETEEALAAIKDVLSKTQTNGLRYLSIKLFERDEKVIEQLSMTDPAVEAAIVRCEEALDDDSESIITNERYQYIGGVVKKCVKKKNTTGVTTSDKIDQIVTNRWLALPIFASVMFLVYFLSVSTVGAWATDWTNDVLFGNIVPNAVGELLATAGTAKWLNSLILDGIIGGVGAVLGFVPQLLVLFFFLAILEDCGYMARVAFIMDRIFRKFGLSGKSFIPMLIGTGCSVPGIMASRTIENEADRRMTIITTSFIPCGAKLPIIALIAGALFGGAWWVAPSAYFIGVAAVIVSGIHLKKTKSFSGDVSPFVMELPTYHIPGLKSVLIHMWDRGWSFIKKAGTIIFISCGLIWMLSNFNASFAMVETSESMLASVGKFIAPIFAPLGFGAWEATVATFTGLIAKENVVGTLGVLLGFAEAAEGGAQSWSVIAANFTAVSAYSFLIFNLLCSPCFAAIGAIRREMGSAKWTFYAVGYQTIFAYTISFIVYQIGSLLTGGGFGFTTALALLVLVVVIGMLFRKPSREAHGSAEDQRALRV